MLLLVNVLHVFSETHGCSNPQVIHKHFYLKRVEVMAQCEEWIADIQQYSSDKRVGRTMSHHAAALKVNKRTLQLQENLAPYQNVVLHHRR